jgi:hypothetical protein
MERIILYSESPVCRALAPVLAGYEVAGAASRLELVRSVVQSGPVLAVVVCRDTLDEGLRKLLASLKRSFPLLNLCLVSEQAARRAGATPVSLAGWTLIDRRQPPEALAAQVRGFLAAIARADRRERPRFDWPLQGRLSIEGRSWQTHNIWALSAGGAFLEAPAAVPPAAGTRASLTISFQNSRLTTACEVLDPRQASSRLPAGFAVRFLQLPEASREILERLVQDALVRTLLQAGEETGAPALAEEELSIGGFEPL